MEKYDKENHARVVIRSMHEFEQSEITWLEEGRIARGKLTLIAGDPGLGKSFMTLELCARVSRGECGPSEPGSLPCAVILSAEDDPGDTIKPRLSAMCANMGRVHIIKGAVMPNATRCDHLQLDRDIDLLVDAIKELPGVTLIVIDPISAYMGKADSHNNAEVRAVLAQLADLASTTGAAVVCVTHLNKDSGNKRAVYRAMGSLAFTAAARTVHLVTKHPGKEPLDDRKCVVSMVKNNIGKPMPARVYVIDRDIFTWLDDEIDLSADELDGNHSNHASRPLLQPDARIDQAMTLLRDELASGSRLATELVELGEAKGINKSTLVDAKRALCVISHKQGRQWYWKLPDRPGEFEHHESDNPSPDPPPYQSAPATHDELLAYGHQGYL